MSKEEAQYTVGTIHAQQYERDAIHIAVYQVTAGEDLRGGGGLTFAYGSNTIVEACNREPQKLVGYIDPFIGREIKKGERFWMFLAPNKATGLRHVYHHPDVDDLPQAPSNEHEAWLRKFASEWNFDYDEMIAIASQGSIKKTMDMTQVGLGSFDIETEWITAQGIDLHSRGELGGDYELFWEHMEGLTGQKFTEEQREKVGWSCSC